LNSLLAGRTEPDLENCAPSFSSFLEQTNIREYTQQ
jgi:hypothetical protein